MSPIFYLINGLYQNHFTPDASRWADASWRVAGLQGVWSLQDAAGDNLKYVTSEGPTLCTQGAVACGTLGCKDNSQLNPTTDKCIINVIWEGFSWYQGTGTPGSGQVDLWGTLTHEKGHWAGCGHSAVTLDSDNNALPTMEKSGSTSGARTVQQDDINCVEAARLGPARNMAANSSLDSTSSQWGGVNGTMWKASGSGDGPTTGNAWWGQNYGVGGSAGIELVSGNGLLGVIGVHQELSDLPQDDTTSYLSGHARSASAAIYEGGISAFFANVIITDSPPPNTNATVLANVYCNFVWNAWTTCTTPYVTSSTGIYTVYVYNGSQQASNVLAVDNLNINIQ